MDYAKHDLLALGAERAAAFMARGQLEGLRKSLYSNTPAGGRDMEQLRDAVDEAVRAAQVAVGESDARYQAEIARAS